MQIGTIKTHVEGLGTLSELVDLVKNPEKITQAHEAARKEFALTEEEQKKATTGREVIAKYNVIKKEIDAKNAELIKVQQELDADKKGFAQYQKAETNRLSDIEAALNLRIAEYKAKDTEYANKDFTLSKYKAELDIAHSKAIKEANDAAAEAQKTAAEHAAATARIEAERTTLKKQAAIIQQQAASLAG